MRLITGNIWIHGLWEGPGSRCIDAAHRNGVPIYGTIFITVYSIKTVNIFAETLKEDIGLNLPGIARKLVDLLSTMALMVNINQETTEIL